MTREAETAAVILNYRDDRHTLSLVRSLLACGEIGRISVVDASGPGGLTGEEEELRDARVLFQKTRNGGYAKGNNLGVAALEKAGVMPAFLLIANPDIEISGESVSRCVRLLKAHPELAVAAPRMLKADGSPHDLPGWRRRTVRGDLAYSSGILARLLGMRREAYPASYWEDPPFVRADCVSGACFLVRAAVFKACGGFDEHTFLFYEEDIFGEKLRRLGLGEAVCTDCAYCHLEGASSRVSLRKYRIMQRSRLYYHRVYRHASPPALAALYAATALGTLECLLKQALIALKFKKD